MTLKKEHIKILNYINSNTSFPGDNVDLRLNPIFAAYPYKALNFYLSELEAWKLITLLELGGLSDDAIITSLGQDVIKSQAINDDDLTDYCSN